MLDPPLPPNAAAALHPLTELADWIEQAALRDLYDAASPALRRSTGLFADRVGGALSLGVPGIPSCIVNRVFLQPSVSPDAAGAAVDRMRKAGVRAYFAHVHAGASPQLIAALAERGLARYHRAWVKLARDRAPLELAGPSTPAGDIELVSARRQQADEFAELVVRCMELDAASAELFAGVVQRPRWHVYFAQLDGRAIATGALFVQGEVGYLSYGATLPEHRGQGLQRMLLAKRIRVALALGCRVIVSETGEAVTGQRSSSYNNMLSLGLCPIATRDNYVLDGIGWS